MTRKAVWNIFGRIAANRSQPLETLHVRDSGMGADFPEGVYRLPGGAFVEPGTGYVVSRAGCLCELSMRTNRVRSCVPWHVDIPSPSDFLTARGPGAQNVIRHPVVISLRHLWDWNYYHFFADVLARLKLLDDVGIPAEIPVVLGKYARDMPFVRQIISRGALSRRTWINPEANYVYADSVIFCHTQQDLKLALGNVVKQMDVSFPDVNRSERIFLTRPASATRKVANVEEIAPVLSKHGFRTCDTSGMSVADQADLFANTRYLVGVHGAGLTNTVFRQGAKMGMIELRASNYPFTPFMEIAESYGYDWSVVEGDPVTADVAQHADFRISPSTLDQKIAEMLAK